MERCQICGRRPAKWVSFKAHQGFVLVRREVEFSGVWCRDCAMEAYVAARGATLKGMWFSPASLVFGTLRSLWDSVKLLDLPDEVKDEPWVPHVVACPYCGQKNMVPAGSAQCQKCSNVFIVASCASCNAVHVVREVEPFEDIRITCRTCGTCTAGSEAIRNCAAMLILRGIAEASAAVAASGGAIGDVEREAFLAEVCQRFDPDDSTKEYLDRYFEDCADGRAAGLLRTFREFCDLEFRRLVLKISWCVARADGVVDESETRVLRALAELLGLDPDVTDEAADAATEVEEPWWEVLKVPREASLDEISFAYRMLAKQFHPDRCTQGPQARRAMAEARMKDINTAYERAREDIRLREERRAAAEKRAEEQRRAAAASSEKAASERAASKEANEQGKATATPKGRKSGAAAHTGARRTPHPQANGDKSHATDGASGAPRSAPSSPSGERRATPASRFPHRASAAWRTGRFLRRHAVAITFGFVGLAILCAVSSTDHRRARVPQNRKPAALRQSTHSPARPARAPQNSQPAAVASSRNIESGRQSLQKETIRITAAPDSLQHAGNKGAKETDTSRAAIGENRSGRLSLTFNVDYVFTKGNPGSSMVYFWVISRANGTSARHQCLLAERGTLTTHLWDWRREDGPFHTHIEDAHGHRLSESVELPSSRTIHIEPRNQGVRPSPIAAEGNRGMDGRAYKARESSARISVREAVDRETMVRASEVYYRKRAAAKP